MPVSSKNTRVENFLIIALCLLPIFLITAAIVKKSDLQEMTYTEAKMKRGYMFLILYIVLSIAVLLLLILYRKGRIV